MIYCMGCMEEMEETEAVCPHCGAAVNCQNPERLLPVGTVLQGRYIVGRSIGNGGFGVTYIGLDGQLKRKIAIKEFFPNKLAGRMADGKNVAVANREAAFRFRNGLDQFLIEAKHLARLSHIQGIVYIYNYFHENGTGYIIMEYLEGMDLRTLLHQHGEKLPYAEARELVLSVLYILRNVHMNGILHRDIAPDNVFVTTDKIVKLIDFGAARHATRGADDSAEILLKVGYAPVEQYSLDGKQGAWTDMYEVGALFYRMLTGVKPIESVKRVKMDALRTPSEMGVDLPEEAEAAIMTSLNVDSRYRIQSARDYMEVLGGGDFRPTEWTVETTVIEGDFEVSERPFFTKRKIAVLAAVCVLIVGGGIGAAWHLRKNVSVVATSAKMPGLAGKSEAEAKQLLAESGVSQVTALYVYDVGAEELVEYQNPEEGTSISPDVEVTLTVASRERVTLPLLEPGQTYDEASAELGSHGIQVERVEDYSETAAKDQVVGYENYAGGEVVTVSERVGLVVSLGKRSDYETLVPNLKGLTAAKAMERCGELHIPLEKISPGKKKYVVKSQSIAANGKINTREQKLTLKLVRPEQEPEETDDSHSE